jgi:hypothetical protein
MQTHQTPRHPAPAYKNLDAPPKSVGRSLLSGPAFPNLIGEARVDGSRPAVIHSYFAARPFEHVHAAAYA